MQATRLYWPYVTSPPAPPATRHNCPRHLHLRSADNVLKTYATAIAIVLTFAVTCVTTRTAPSLGFLAGLSMVIASIFLYSFGGKPKPPAKP